MSFKYLFLLFLILRNIFSFEYGDDDLQKILQEVVKFLQENSNMTIIMNDIIRNSTCLEAILNSTNNRNGTVSYLISILGNSGKGLDDTGVEENCLSDNMSYLFLTYRLDYSISLKDSDYRDYYVFVNQVKFFTGLCLWKECVDFYKNFLNRDLNAPFFEFAESKGFTNIKLAKLDYDKESLNDTVTTPKMKDLIIFIWIFIGCIIFRSIVTVLGYFMYEIHSESDNTSADHYDESNSSLNQFNEVTKSKENLFKTRRLDSKPENKSYFYHTYKLFSLRRSLRILFSHKTKYYNERNAEILAGVRVYLMLMLVYSQNIYAMTRSPHRDFGGFSFYSSFWFFLGKYATYSNECIIALDGISLGFKLMNYIKEREYKLRFKDMLRFYFKCIPQFIIFFISFFIFHVYIKEIGTVFGNSTIYDYYMENHVLKTCTREPFKILIPFYTQYLTPGYDCSFPYCYRYVHYVLTEFTCFTFVLLLIYLVHRIKNSKLDFALYVINILALILSYVSYDHTTYGSTYTLAQVLGESRIYTQPHLFINLYFLGFNVGMMYFYFLDVTSTQPITSTENYISFKINFTLMKFFDRMSSNSKLFLIIFSLIAQVLISFDFYIFLKIYCDKNDLVIPGNLIIDLCFVYLSRLFTIFFLLFFIGICFYDKDLPFKHLLMSKIFIPFNRINFTFFCIQDFVFYLFYGLYSISLYLNFQNALFISLSLLVFIVLLSFILVILIEMPIRILYKNILRLEKKKIL